MPRFGTLCTKNLCKDSLKESCDEDITHSTPQHWSSIYHMRSLMDSNGNQSDDQQNGQTVSEKSSVEEPIDNKWSDNEVNSKSLDKPEAKEDPRFRKVESRYKQSTQQWVHRRSDDLQLRPDVVISGATGSRNRNPTPNAKTNRPLKKASTPMSTDKSLNVSGISVINKVNGNHELNPNLNLKKYGKGLITGRKSIAPKKLPFGSDGDANGVTSTATSRAIPMAVGADNETKMKEMENSLLESSYLNTLSLNLKAKQMKSERNDNSFNKISQIWSQTNEMRTQLLETQKCVLSLQNTIESTEILEKQKKSLEEYLKMRSQMDSLFNHLSELIVEQKLLLKIENCSQHDFNKLNELMETSPNSLRFESFDMISNASLNIEKSVNIYNEINSMESKLKESYKIFTKCVKDLEKYERIANKMNSQKMPSLSKLF
ncbi:unnamed protein product [Oppiella nova]|uniref:Uncharacterized protein n=1 Tax=Oppiella nova TaxID=334625 RepID=A0A7R9LLR4_9ACAR|nr:unnamed protein product [Oppiella nova]CAG2164243.1 unnamed protein product [Oppiella nova]